MSSKSSPLWRNWGRNQVVAPKSRVFAKSVAEVQETIVAAVVDGRQLRAVGAGHSFSSIAVAPSVQLDLAGLSGLISIDLDRSRATFAAGTKLHDAGALLAEHGLAMQNLGDIDTQTLSGAISTGTHGTGGAFGGIATQVVGATLALANGELLTVDESQNTHLLPAVQVGLGALGVLVEVTLQCVPSFLLEAIEIPEDLDAVLEALPERVAAVDHFEFYWFPHTKVALTKTNTRLPSTSPTVSIPPLKRWLDDTILGNRVFAVTCAVGHTLPAVVPAINRLATKGVAQRTYTEASTSVFASPRTVRFVEQEYAVPAETVPEVLRQINSLIERRGWKISFPLEVRFAAADDTWLSTAFGRKTGYIAIHRYFRDNPREYFSAVEEICRAVGGRPHWGKMHTQKARQLAVSYPQFNEFRAVRESLDPGHLFTNGYIRTVLDDL
jgi:FAD-linked oxidoreductase